MNSDNLPNIIFFIHTPYQLRVARDIIKTFSSNKIYIILETRNHNESTTHHEEENIITLNVPLVHPRDNYKKSTINSRLSHALIKKTIEMEKCLIFLSDINWPLNNWVFNKYKKNKFFLFEEGLGNYLSLKRGFQDILRGTAKQILYLLNYGPYFKNYLGEQMGGDQKRINGNYFYKPNLSFSSGKKIQIKTKSQENSLFRLPDDSVVFLEQPYIKNFGVEKYKEILKKIKIKFKGKSYYIKRHHFEDEIINYSELGFNQIQYDGPIENTSLGDNVTLVSFNSSALFNMKLIYGNEIKCVSIHLFETLKFNKKNTKDINKIEELFNNIGIKLCR